MKLITLPLIFSGLLLTAPAWAQDAEQATPRESIVEELALTGEIAPAIVERIEIVIEEETEGTDALPAEIMPEPEAELIKETIAEPVIEDPAEIIPSAPVLAPFYVSAEEYLGLRGEDDAHFASYEYEVVTQGLEEDAIATTSNISLNVGTNYVAIEAGNKTRIYDFKQNRLLTLSPELGSDGKNTGRALFDNVSLYARAFRNTSTVMQMTGGGKIRGIKLGADKELDAFWVESAMSWAARKLEAPLGVKAKKDKLKVFRGEQMVFAAKFSDEPYVDRAFKESLLVFAHHDWPLYPSVLQALYEYDRPIKHMEIISYGPSAPDGEKQIWSLIGRDAGKDAFPLPIDAIGAAQRIPPTPLVFVINEAVQGRAFGGTPSAETIEADFDVAVEAKKSMAAWLLGQKYIAYTGACKIGDMSKICEDIKMIEQAQRASVFGSGAGNNQKFADYIKAFSPIKGPGTRAETVKALRPYLNKPDTPAIVLRRTAMARAGLKPRAAKLAGVVAVDPEALLRQSMAKDPYDKHTYLGLAQVYAARGAYEQSWDIYDALRAGVPGGMALAVKIDSAEEKLRQRAPGYFLQD